jgi:ketosteroid isomerase-like protein
MNSKNNRLLLLLAAAGLLAAGSAAAQSGSIEAQVIALAKSQWAAEDQRKPSAEAWASIADDYTEFNPDAPTRIDGKALAAKFYDGFRQGSATGLVSEMLNPKVQVYGDTAILSYNYAGLTRDKDGKIEPNFAKSTRVYVKQAGSWKLVHANFGAVPALDN